MIRRIVIILVLAIAVAVMLHHRKAAAAPPPAQANVDVAPALRSLVASPPPAKQWLTEVQGDRIVGHCAKPCLSREEAEISARADAARAVYWMIVKQFGEDSRSYASSAMKDIQAGKLQIDSLAEKFERPYGTIWAESVLVDASPSNLQKLIEPYRREFQARQRRAEVVCEAAVAITLAAWGMCLALNVVTRGYFTLRLEVIAATITALAVIIGIAAW